MGDDQTRLALPFKTLLNDKNFFYLLKEVCKAEKIERIIVGIPLPLQGKDGEQVKRARDFKKELKKEIRLPIETIDERFTTREVESRFEDAKKQLKKADKDAIAAAIILQSYFDKL